jgi:hypothetical protein
MLRRLLVTGLLLAALPTADAWAEPAKGLEIDRSALEAVEDLTESLANDLLLLSVRTKRMDLPAISAFFGDDFAADGLPSVAGALRRDVKWISTHGWEIGNPNEITIGRSKPDPEAGIILRSVGRAEFLGQVERFLSHFSEIEDARFKVKDATFDDPSVPEGRAVVKFYVVGRDRAGRREWVHGLAEIAAARRGDTWQITRWHTASMISDVAATDLFSEVGIPAGIDHTFPRFGVAPGDGFVSHGGAVGDVNGDGLMDLLLTEVDGARLYLNDGKGGFTDISGPGLLSGIPSPTAAVFLDYDQDGDSDIFMSAVGSQMLFENRVDPNGVLRFHDVSAQAGVAVPAVGFSVAVADVNGDGLPDVYVTSYNHYGSVMPDSWARATNGTPNLLFINIGSGRFRESAKNWGVDDRRWGYAAAFADVNGDGWQDLYLANDFGENALYINKRLRFEDEAALRGVLDPGNGMGVAWGDYDNDGDLDLHVTNMSSTAGNRILGRLMPEAGRVDSVLRKLAAGSSLFRNRGNGWFTDVSAEAGPFGAGWAYGGGFIDFDNDGWEDEFSVNGFVSGNTMNDT